ncbi:substrate-binding domain-containing protein [Streptomyces sp. NPDC002992]|uniref:vWA domain-containing protein n=1 Tax=Streptomyces sp. NPDC002992 TaxID=3154273 RepID=UPI0033AE7831
MARFDPRGRVNHALLVTVPAYTSDLPPDPSGVLGDIAAVRHNSAELARALRAGGVFREEDITTSSPTGSDLFFRDLMRARDRADGLLLLYFAGHGLVSSYNEPDELWLGMPRTTIVPGNPPTFVQAVRWSEVLPALCQARAEQVVVVLDCCHAGNASAAWNKLPADQRERVSLLACVQANDRIDAGDADTPTPFTAHLVRVLDEGVDGGGEVSFGSLAEALRTYMPKNHTTLRKKPTPWVPQSCPADGTDVVLAVPAGSTEITQPPTPPPPPPGPPRPGPRWRRIPVLAWAALALTLVVLLGYALFRTPPGSACTTPLELRLLTDADAEPTVRKAVNAYLESDASRDGDCRRSGITVYSAKATDAVAAFRDSSRFWQDPDPETNPQRDVGPQPDIWIPGSAAAVERARSYAGGGTSVTLTAHKPFVHSPMVLAVPAHLAEGSEKDRSGRTLAQFAETLRARAADAVVARTDPEHTDSGLLATVGLYGNRPGAAAAVERGLAPGRPLPDGRALLCDLPRAAAVDTKTAALVPEHLLKTGLGCGRQTRTPRVAEYPSDVPRLALPFVQVVWDGGDRDKGARDSAVDRFRAWLTGEAGVAAFTADGYRPGPGDTPSASSSASPPAAGALADPGRLPDAGDATTMNAALEGYRKADGPGRVLFLLDNSGSMKGVWAGPGGAPGIIQQALAGLGPQDEYGVWSVSSAPGATRPYTPLLALGRHKDRDAARKTIGDARLAGNEADPFQALKDASAAMETQGEDDDSRPRLIVFVTDDEDNSRIGDRMDGLLTSLRQSGVPVVMASLDVGGCAKGRAGERIAEASGGRCLDSSGDLIAGLRDEVARTGTGEAT